MDSFLPAIVDDGLMRRVFGIQTNEVLFLVEFLDVNDCGIKDEWSPIEFVLDDVVGLEVDFFKGKLGIFLRILFEPDDGRWLI